MKITNIESVKKNIQTNQDTVFYYCYSPNLYKFLRWYKKIEPIDIGVHRITNKKYSIFIKCDILQKALIQWRQNKVTGNLAIPTQMEKSKVGDSNE